MRPLHHLLPLLALAALAGAVPAAARPAKTDYAAVVADSARSDANRKLDEGRMPAAILAFAAFRPGDVVADYQAGGGYSPN